MTENAEVQLEQILATNPFLSELDKWQKELDAFRDGNLKLGELQFVLQSDENNFTLYQQRYARRTEDIDTFLHPEVLPQPFIGDPRAPIWYILLNPGYSFPDRYDHLGVCSFCGRKLFAKNGDKEDCIFDKGKDKIDSLKKRQLLLLRQLRLECDMPFYLLDNAFDTLNGAWKLGKEGGYNWWRTILFGANTSEGFVLPECGVKQDSISLGRKIFVIECAPYHSRNFDRKVLWEGSKYTEFWAKLISWAIDTGRKFIVRSKYVDNLLTQNNLNVNKTNSLRFSSGQNVSLTKQNLIGDKCVKDAIFAALLSQDATANC